MKEMSSKGLYPTTKNIIELPLLLLLLLLLIQEEAMMTSMKKIMEFHSVSDDIQ